MPYRLSEQTWREGGILMLTARLQDKGGRYYCVINYKDGENRRQKWIALGISTKESKQKALKLMEEKRAEFESRMCLAGSTTYFVDYIEKWLNERKGVVQQTTWEGDETYVYRHIIPYFEPLKLLLVDVKPIHIKQYYEYKYTQGRLDGKEGGLSISTLKKHALILKQSLDCAVLEEYIVSNPTAVVKMPAKEIPVREKKFLTLEEANEVIQAFQGHPLQAMIYVTLYYGLRKSEVLGLRWSSIDFRRNTLTINHSVVKVKGGSIAKDQMKTASSYREYELIEDVRKVLLELRASQEVNRRLFQSEYVDNDYIFKWENGKPFRPDTITRSVERHLKAKGLPEITYHTLRHSTASILYDMGWDIMDIKHWLRHSSIDVTADIYTHISNNRKKKLSQKLVGAFEPLKK
jgi:integrase